VEIKGKVVLVTGANRGLGEQFAKALLAAGASKVYASARDKSQVKLPGVHPAFIDTDMTAGIDAPKTTPEAVVRQVLEGLEQGNEEILVDDIGRSVKGSLSSAAPAYLTPAH
jgi:NAD(P)-dependent dehydrogenase (short-subunit alcohol dehydrogenase family)